MRYGWLILLLLLAGCATAQSTSDDVVPRYQGKSIDLVTQRWGTPTRTVKGDGGTIYLRENVPPARGCRVEAHADARNNIIGIRGVGDDQSCAAWLRMLK